MEDLGGTNGTFVGERRIERADLEDRSEFRVGSQFMGVLGRRQAIRHVPGWLPRAFLLRNGSFLASAGPAR